MRRVFPMTLFAIVGVFGLAFGEAKVSIPNATFNFGKTVQQAVLTHDFWIKSVGDEPVVVTKVVPGCGCTQSHLSDSTIAPGDSTRMHLIFSTGRFRGYVGKQPYLLIEGSEQKQYMKIYAYLEIKPEDSRPVVIDPVVVDVSQFDERPRRRASFSISNPTDKDLKISVVDSSFKSFAVEIPKIVKAGESVNGLVTVNEDMVENSFQESFTIGFDDIESSLYTIPVRRDYYVESERASQGK
jgi:hypothetical protein